MAWIEELHPNPLRQRLSERQGILGGLAEHRLYRHRCGIGGLFPGAGPVPDAAAPWTIHETGVYLAMGISKGSVLLQCLLEVILVAAIALVISFGTSTAISHQIGSSLLSQVTSETYETVDLTGENEAAEENLPRIWALPRSRWLFPPRITHWYGLSAWCCVWPLPHWRPTQS